MVDVVADGVVMQASQVVAGAISIAREANKVCVGLHYVTKVETLPSEMEGTNTTMQGSNTRIGEAVLRFMTTTGCRVNGDVVPFRSFGAKVLDKPAAVFTGDHKIELSGWNNTLVVEQDQPLPFYLLAVIKKVAVND